VSIVTTLTFKLSKRVEPFPDYIERRNWSKTVSFNGLITYHVFVEMKELTSLNGNSLGDDGRGQEAIRLVTSLYTVQVRHVTCLLVPMSLVTCKRVSGGVPNKK
jgi:hypothetical protein